MDERPIKGNSNGKYDMNFIDPTNDICSYYSGLQQIRDIVEQYFQTITYHKQIVSQEIIGKTVKVTSETKSNNIKLQDCCSVCLQQFKEGQQIKVLVCTHCFHKKCVLPWFQDSTKCPNCRFDIFQGQSSSQKL